MKRFLFISILSLCFSTICSCACLDEIKTFYTGYMMNLLKNDSNNIALCKMYLTDGLLTKVQRMVNTSGVDPIIRSQDVNDDAIRTLNVRNIADSWYMVSYLWNEKDSTTVIKIPLKVENVGGKCKIAYITPVQNGVQYGDELLSYCENMKACKIDEASEKTFVESFYKVYIASYCTMCKDVNAKLSTLRLSNLSHTALEQFAKAELENQKDGFNGYDLLINNFDFDCMWCKSLKFAQLGNDDFQISYQVGSKIYKIIVTIKKQNNRYLIDKISF